MGCDPEDDGTVGTLRMDSARLSAQELNEPNLNNR
jgi:hypothetical protein